MTTGANKNNGLCGVRYWAQIYPTKVPRFEVFEFSHTDVKDVHWFVARRDGAKLGKTMLRIGEDRKAGLFKPFLLDLKRITARMDGE